MTMWQSIYSSQILRCDILSDVHHDENAVCFEGYALSRSIRRKILPKRHFDDSLEQDCYFYRSLLNDGPEDGLVALIPLLQERSESAVPFYHPKVAGIAFRYFTSSHKPYVLLDFLPLQAPSNSGHHCDTPFYASASRTYRTGVSLLTIICKHGSGMNPDGASYIKRVHHDTIVPRVAYQDAYMTLRDKYTWIIKEWKESTDPVKHVFEVRSGDAKQVDVEAEETNPGYFYCNLPYMFVEGDVCR